MQEIIKAFWQVALFRQGPDYLPDSRPLLVFSVAAYVIVDVLVILALYPRHNLPPLLLLDVGFLAIWCIGLLRIFGFPQRTRQTLTALFGVGALLQIMAFPFTAWPSLGMPFELPLIIRGLVSLSILLWSVAVYGHILSQALSRTYGAGISFAVIYFIVIYQFAAIWTV